jgi:transposase
VGTNAKALREVFGGLPRSRVALETGTHSPWISRLLGELGHEVIVSNARKLRLIGESRKKDDRRDAQTLARLARIDAQLLCPVKHRSAQGQADLAMIRARASLVRARTGLVNAARGLAKSYGERLRGCNVRNMDREKAEVLSPELRAALEPLLAALESVSQQICEYNHQRIESLAQERYPQTALLKQVKGVGTLIALTFELVIGTPERFQCAKQIASYVGLVPSEESSGDRRRLGHISKQGNVLVRFLLVEAAQVTVRSQMQWRSQFFHLAMRRGRKIAKVAMARKLAVELYWMWRHGWDYEKMQQLGSHAGEPGNPHGVQ